MGGAKNVLEFTKELSKIDFTHVSLPMETRFSCYGRHDLIKTRISTTLSTGCMLIFNIQVKIQLQLYMHDFRRLLSIMEI